MMAKARTQLLADLAGLLKKHGPEPFVELVKLIKARGMVGDFLAILELSVETKQHARAVPDVKRPPAKPRKRGKGPLKGLVADDPAKASLLREFHQQLVDKAVLPTLRDVRHFAHDHGLKPVKATGREKAISPLLRDLSGVATDRLSDMLAKIPQAEPGGRSLQGWTSVILADKRK